MGDNSGSEPLPHLWKAAIFSAAATAFLFKILLAVNTYGTNDVYAWERFALWGRYLGADIYHFLPAFNHPPFMIHGLAFLRWLTDKSGVGFPFWLRLPAILADIGSLLILCRLLAPRLHEPSIRWAILFVALSPTLILVSGFHGNTDSVVIFFLLLSIWLTERGTSDWAPGAALGMALCIKVFPVFLIPVMLFYRRNYRRRLVFLATMSTVIVLCSMPYIFQAPTDIIRNVLGYRSLDQTWGLSYPIYLSRKMLGLYLSLQMVWADSFFKAKGPWLLLGLITAMSYLMNRSSKRPPLYSQCAILLFLFLVGASGFGVQYLAWLVPFTVASGALPAAVFLVTSGAFLLLVYNYWSQGMPWYLADSRSVGGYVLHLNYFQILCWLSVVLLLWAAWTYARTGALWEEPLFRHRLATSMVAGFLLTAAVVIPMGRKLYQDANTFVPRGKDAIPPIEAARYNDLYRILQQTGRISDARQLAEEAIRSTP